MKTSANGKRLIKEFEGVSYVPYDDVAGKLTVGVGHLLKKTDNFKYPLTEAQVDALLEQDLSYAESAVNQAVCVNINQNQFDALVSWTFNLGGGNLLKSTLLRLLNDGLFKEAANQFLRWNKAAGKEVAGLTRRRKAERELFLT